MGMTCYANYSFIFSADDVAINGVICFVTRQARKKSELERVNRMSGFTLTSIKFKFAKLCQKRESLLESFFKNIALAKDFYFLP